jgi:hypothetical protein
MFISAVNVTTWVRAPALCGKELLDVALMANKIHRDYILVKIK